MLNGLQGRETVIWKGSHYCTANLAYNIAAQQAEQLLAKHKAKVKYTLNFTCSRGVKQSWVIDAVDELDARGQVHELRQILGFKSFVMSISNQVWRVS
jgi:hypothetical protein